MIRQDDEMRLLIVETDCYFRAMRISQAFELGRLGRHRRGAVHVIYDANKSTTQHWNGFWSSSGRPPPAETIAIVLFAASAASAPTDVSSDDIESSAAPKVRATVAMEFLSWIKLFVKY